MSLKIKFLEFGLNNVCITGTTKNSANITKLARHHNGVGAELMRFGGVPALPVDGDVDLVGRGHVHAAAHADGARRQCWHHVLPEGCFRGRSGSVRRQRALLDHRPGPARQAFFARLEDKAHRAVEVVAQPVQDHRDAFTALLGDLLVYTLTVGNDLGPDPAENVVVTDDLPDGDLKTMNFGSAGGSKATAWRDIWGAGQGVGTIDDIPSVADLVARMEAEYREAASRLCVA